MDDQGEQLIWGVATMLVRRHGERAANLVAERIRTSEIEGEESAHLFWIAIGCCLDELSPSAAEH